MSSQTGRGGFTLLEILVAVSVMAILMTAIYGIFNSISSTAERLQADSEIYHRARVLFDRLGRELRGTYYTQGSSLTGFRGERDGLFSSLTLTTTAVTPAIDSGRAFARVDYRTVTETREDLTIRTVERREVALEDATEDGALEQARWIRLMKGVSAFQIRYFSDQDWRDSWDATVDGLPEVVEIRLQITDERGEEVPFLSAFDLPAGRATR